MADDMANAEEAKTWRIGVDIGGTFTDIILLGPDDVVVTGKVLSSPPDFATSVIRASSAAVQDAGILPSQVGMVLHGTTVATNAILEMRGAVTALVTTVGFRDVLELGRLRRPRLYDLSWEKPPTLAMRRHRYELAQRITFDAQLDPAFAPAALDALCRQLAEDGVESVAVCLINSYLRPDEERRVAAQIREALPDVYVTASVDISPEIYEFERTSTAVVNSYVGPVVKNYVHDLDSQLRSFGIDAPFLIMQSSGGLMPSDVVKTAPVQIIESGPAAGVTAALQLAAAMSLDNVVAFDMGGTTAKASLIENGTAFVASDYEVGGGMSASRGLSKGGGYLVRVPSIDIAEVGAGGGSIISIDAAGALHVGPESASARPGPACYGQGGDRPTLTDANVVLGYLNPTSLAGGHIAVQPELAESVLDGLAQRLGAVPVSVARGAYEVAVSNMTKAVKSVTSERGRDPRDSVMIAFGGAGPLYCAYLARELGISTVVVPAYPGLFSSLGLLVADTERQHALPFHPSFSDTKLLAEAFGEMEAATLLELADQGTDANAVVIDKLLDMRYHGQRFELRIALPAGGVDDDSLAHARQRFHAEHHRTYGRSGADELVEIVNLRVRGRSPNPTSIERILASSSHHTREAEVRMCRFDDDLETPVVTRAALGPLPVAGPLIIEDMDSTTLVPPGANCHLDALNSIVISWTSHESKGNA